MTLVVILVRYSLTITVNSQHHNLDSYQYSPLPGDGYIRVLELQPGVGNEPLHGTLSDVSLYDSELEFESLSYVWGDLSLSGTKIDLGRGQCLPIQRKLEDALYNLRHKSKTRALWIDALCINQDDYEEKSSQIQLMAEIYARCTSVIVWLGMPDANSELGLDILSFLSNSNKRIGGGGAPWDHLPSEEVITGLQDILQRGYFHRLWVVQEAALAKRIQMYVGTTSIEWSRAQTRKFLMRIKMTELSPSWMESELSLVDFRPIRELLEQSLAADARRKGAVEVPSLLDLVHSIRHRNCADPRDRIYGVMSLVTPAEVAGFVPDYSLSWEETYRRFYDTLQSQVLKDPSITVEDMKAPRLGRVASNEE